MPCASEQSFWLQSPILSWEELLCALVQGWHDAVCSLSSLSRTEPVICFHVNTWQAVRETGILWASDLFTLQPLAVTSLYPAVLPCLRWPAVLFFTFISDMAATTCLYTSFVWTESKPVLFREWTALQTRGGDSESRGGVSGRLTPRWDWCFGLC